MQKELCLPSLLIKMRVSILVFVSSFLLLSLVLSSMAPVNANPSTSLVELKHAIQVTRGGLIIITDTISLHNTDVEPIISFSIGFHKDYATNLDNATAFTSLGKPLTIREGDVDAEHDIYWLDLSFPEPITQNQDFGFSVVFAFSKLINYTDFEPILFTALVPKYPALTTEAASCTVEISLPEETTFFESSWGNATSYVKQPLEENSNQTGSVTFAGTLQYMEFPVAGRKIVIDAWGNVLADDYYEIHNIGIYDVYGLSFTLPSNAEEVTAYDAYGPLTTDIEETGENGSVYVTFRYPLRGEYNGVPFHDSYSCTIQYHLKKSEHMTQTTPLSSYQIAVEMFSCPDWTIKSLETEITFPEGADYIQASPSPTRTSQDLFTQSITYTTNNLTQNNSYALSIIYDYNVFWSAFRPTLWIGIATITIGGIAALRKGKQPKPSPTPSKDTEEVLRCIEACNERMGLWLELENLEKDFENRRIRRKDFNRRRRIFTQRITSLDKEISNYESGVKRMGPKYAELITKLKAAAGEVHTMRSEIKRLKNQLRSGRLSKTAYEKQREPAEKRIQGAKAVIEEVIVDLRRLVS
jgi:hypothetical protein